ncbi:daptide-type RiPP biosynthesis dehydogenase [Streptomyces sp. JJ38]|uniref:daptide-type RiPP biosynthesis dehydogenase n=1 Tax=Streptomyces sp. JJ38 TaxID=2738128 RepID=UPI001C57FD79|nr:daptide-type RiPP biosynthesis dehydogenase [Streptomyces sp. JJ38]MBW1596581.1 iron-containing alcohol dehydrogenase [Streptomyces sp. JJ38]
MSLGWHCPTLVLLGVEGFGDWLATRPERRVTVLADPALARGPLTTRLLSLLRSAGAEATLVPVTAPGTVARVEGLAGRLAADGTELLVAVGGGTVIDQAKLAVAVRGDGRNTARLGHPQRAGLVVLPSGGARALPLVAVPTTVGTGAELSAAACVEHGDGRRLVLGDGLRPDVALVDPAATATLPGELLAEGVLEALFRASSLYAGAAHDQPTEDALTEALVARLTVLGEQLARARGTLGAHAVVGDDVLRAEIAKVSGLTHGPWAAVGRERYGAKGWFLANELSWTLGVRKMTAVAALLPPLWRAVTEDPGAAWGSARRLARVWETVRAAGSPRWPADPADGVAALIDAWGIGRRLTADPARIDDVVRRTQRAWGAGLPMLRGVPAGSVRRVLSAAVAPEGAATAGAAPDTAPAGPGAAPQTSVRAA